MPRRTRFWRTSRSDHATGQVDEGVAVAAALRILRGPGGVTGSAQAGATAHRVGPDAMATSHELQYRMGIPARKVPVFEGFDGPGGHREGGHAGRDEAGRRRSGRGAREVGS